jgi:hypothetical protein
MYSAHSVCRIANRHTECAGYNLRAAADYYNTVRPSPRQGNPPATIPNPQALA